MNKLLRITLPAWIIMTLPGCSTQQIYDTGQSWQRNQCSQIIDQSQRAQCLSDTETPYNRYRQQSGSGENTAR